MKATVATTNPAGFGQIFASPPREFRSPGQVVSELLRAATANIVAFLHFDGLGNMKLYTSGTSGDFAYAADEIIDVEGVKTATTRTAYDWTLNPQSGINYTGPLTSSPAGPLSVPALVDFIANAYGSEEFGVTIDQIGKTIRVMEGDVVVNPEPDTVATFQLSEGNTWE